MDFAKAQQFLTAFKGDRYIYGIDVLDRVGEKAVVPGKSAVFVADSFPGADQYIETIWASLKDAGVDTITGIPGAGPNAPREDLQRLTTELKKHNPDFIVSFGGGSTIDCAKAANVLSSLGGEIEDYFGVGLVKKTIESGGKKLLPHLAIQTAASSGAHLTKYSNITDIKTGQKKLIVDTAIVPDIAFFDYGVTTGAPRALVADGALDGIAHSLEVLYGAAGKDNYAKIEEVALEGISLIVRYLPVALADRSDTEAFMALGLATDLGGYAIMLGGTNGAHLTSFSLVDVLSHGRACGIMNPYYTVFFAPAIQTPLKKLAALFQQTGYLSADYSRLGPRDLGMAVARAMIDFAAKTGNPTRLADVEGFTDSHIERALNAAKNPQLKMKLENMPVALTAAMVDEYMGPVLQAAKSGDLELIKNV